MRQGITDLFDAHFHIIDPDYPLIPNQGYLPDGFSRSDYQQRFARYSLVGGVLVSGSFHGFDQGYLISALKRLGEGYVGITQLPADVSDAQLALLDRAGVRGVRFNLFRGGSETVDRLDYFAHRLYEHLGWHVELYLDGAALQTLRPLLIRLPAVVIDHLGLTHRGAGDLLRLAERGVKVKACGFGRVDFDIAARLRDLYKAHPDALMFGSDLPSTRAPRPFEENDITLIQDTLGDAASEKVLCDNALKFYKVQRTHPTGYFPNG
jgi:predicted TIM-barrel fold metal-dependent hydrolase